MNKKTKLIFIFAFLLASLLFFPSVSAADVCCEKTIDGKWCQQVDDSQCPSSSRQPPTSCESTSFCSTGTCVDTAKGSCSANTPKVVCDVEGGTWYAEGIEDVPLCRNGCCTYGDSADFITSTECKQIGTDLGIETNFLSNVRDEVACLALGNQGAEGACVTEGLSRSCSMTTKSECISQGGSFNEGFLCSADFLNADCAPSQNTLCHEDGKVYFLDTCGNYANVYDVDMFNEDETAWDKEMKDYWTKISEPTCGPAGSDCGDCDYLGGTTCKLYSSLSENSNTAPPTYGNYVCADLSCFYDNNKDGRIQTSEQYKHGESWCASTPGVYFDESQNKGIFVDIDNLSEIDSEVLDDLKYTFSDSSSEFDPIKPYAPVTYNLPGSRYVKLTCIDGEVIAEPCSDFRNEFCADSLIQEDPDYRRAQCVANGWRDCVLMESKTECESSGRHCQWLSGYRFDGENKNSNQEYNLEEQGSCVPLIAPGLDFYSDDETIKTSSAYCNLANQVEQSFYETNAAFGDGGVGGKAAIIGLTGAAGVAVDIFGGLTNQGYSISREDLAGANYSGEDGQQIRIKRCWKNCFAIPGYGTNTIDDGTRARANLRDAGSSASDVLFNDESVNNLIAYHKGEQISSSLRDLIKDWVSDRQGYYCHKKNDEREKTGTITGRGQIDCAKDTTFNNGEAKRNNFPIFWTNEQWQRFMMDRARTLGDCGYKPNAQGSYPDANIESVSVFFQTFKQDIETVREETETQIIEEGDTLNEKYN